MTDKLNPRQRLAHKLRDGKYRAKLMGCPVEHVSILDPEVLRVLLHVRHCYYCGREIAEDEIYALEHKEPLKLGGAHTLANLAKACQGCNEDKHMQTELDYLASLDTMIWEDR